MSFLSYNSFKTGWDHFFYEEVSTRKVAFFRILIGFFLALNAASLLPDWREWFSVYDGLVPLAASKTYYLDPRVNLFNVLAPSDTVTLIILWSSLISSICLMLGLKTRVMTVIAFVLLVSIQNRNYAILNSGDTLMRCMLFLMMFTPSDRSFSLDNILRRSRGISVPETMSAWPLRLLQIQFAIVYWATTLFKVRGFDWVEGTATYYTSRLANFQRLRLPFFFDSNFMVKLTTWGALFTEFALGILIWVKEWRYAVLLAGIGLHIGIELTMSIGFFEWMMMAAYILFVEDKHFDMVYNWCLERLAKKAVVTVNP